MLLFLFHLKNKYEEVLPEKIHSRFCKFILGVNKYASYLGSKAELGRYQVVISDLFTYLLTYFLLTYLLTYLLLTYLCLLTVSCKMSSMLLLLPC